LLKPADSNSFSAGDGWRSEKSDQSLGVESLTEQIAPEQFGADFVSLSNSEQIPFSLSNSEQIPFSLSNSEFLFCSLSKLEQFFWRALFTWD
jgi:hypothetical protein